MISNRRSARSRAAEAPEGVVRDPLARLLEIGLVALVIVAPWPLGSVVPEGRLGLEIGCALLGALWLIRALRSSGPAPPLAVRVGIVGLLVLGLIQLIPFGAGVVRIVSPRAAALRSDSLPPAEIDRQESGLLQAPAASFRAPATLSLDPDATASALRTAAALTLIFLVAHSVAAARGARLLAVGLLISGAFQGLYGLLVLVSGFDRIWHLPKEYNLNAATGTFVSNNHFSCFLAICLAAGLGLLLEQREESGASPRAGLSALLSPERGPQLLLGLLGVVALTGLLTSFSRAGIALGLFGMLLTLLAVRGGPRRRSRIFVFVLIVAAAAVPLAQVGSDRLLDDYLRTGEELRQQGGRVTVWRDTVKIAAAFPAVGAGYGTFASVYPVFRSPEVRKLYIHAHNDPLQALAEGGGLGALFWSLLLVPIGACIVAGLGGRKGRLAVGFAAGLTVFLLHGLVDFNGHIPANAATASVVAGTLLGLPWLEAR